MKAKTSIKLVLSTMAILAVPALHAADEPVRSGNVVSGEITPKLYYFDYSKGFGTNMTQFLERYNYQKSGDNRSGFYPDADVSLLVTNPQRDVFVLERQGFGAYNHRGTVKADSDKLGFTGYYSSFRSATGGIDFLYSPNQVSGGTDPTYNVPANTNSGYVARFSDDSGQTLFKIDRTTFGAGIALKPELFGKSASVLVNYDGYKRDGNRFASYALGGSDVTGANPARVLQRWRGFDMKVDEKMDRLSLNLTGTPGGGLQLVYDGSVEKFSNQARDYTIADFAANIAAAGTTTAAGLTKPLTFSPDSSLMTHGIRAAKNFGSTAVAAGYGLSILDQDSFTQEQQTAGYGTGKIKTNSAYLNVRSGVLPSVGLEGFVRYYDRKNDSTFPAVGLINPVDPSGDGEQLDVRIDKIKSLNYGLAATFRPATLKSTVTVGWKREDKDRDLSWSAVTLGPPVVNGIAPQRSLYRQETLSDELYANWVMRPMQGLIVRVTPSYLRADKTGLITEPEESTNLKAKVSYAAINGMAVSGYYNYKNKKNGNNTFTDALVAAPHADSTSYAQDRKNTLQSAGVSLSAAPSEKLNTTASLSWLQNDFSSYFFSSTGRRYRALSNGVLFQVKDTSNYQVDTYVLSLGGDLRASDVLGYSGSYSFSQSKGHNASGYVGAALPTVDEQVNNDVQTLSLGVNYALKKTVTLRGAYTYEYYKDKVYSGLTGGLHSLMLGVQLGF